MSYSVSDINTINRTASAVKNKTYSDITGTTYIGLDNGRLKIVPKTITKDVQRLIDDTFDVSIEDVIVDGVTTKAPSQNAVYDALQLYLLLTGGTLTGTLTLASGITITGAGGTATISFDGGTGVKVNKKLYIGTASANTGTIYFYNGTNANLVDIRSGITSADYSITLPTTVGTNGQYLRTNNSGVLTWVSPISTIGISISGSGYVIAAGQMQSISMPPYAGIITGWYLLETSSTPISCTCVLDIWKDTYANYPPTVADTIFGTKPSLTTATKNTATGLSIAFSANDIFKYVVDSNNLAENLQLILLITRT